ncbi:hypothetical protein J7382_11530 [Shimia sp. R11_0]|uniref:hypothetical protein n=1 Tax=Shimia sp. R11_0 TaxID=2821096 RepID=UPI001ADD4BA0|nr:hypothetical protein [Shimia sp. R11_0]MBO9478167.1 hypothetical protein [Shimia sp. R11_0]
MSENTLVAQTICTREGHDFAKIFKFQFVLSKTPPKTSESWRAYKVSDWTLQACPSLRVTPVLDSVGDLVGWFLGIGITAAGDAITQSLPLPAQQNADDFFDKAQDVIHGIAGRFAIILATSDKQRMYFDAALDQSVVYNADAGLIASSATLAAFGEPQTNPLFDRDAILNGHNYYAFEHTSDPRVERAFPNHYLDLKTFALPRVWPLAETPFDIMRARRNGLISRMERRLRQIMHGLLRNFDCCLPISGGHDSRLLLSYGKGELHNLSTAFSHATNHNTLVDSLIAANICKIFDVPHQVINVFGEEHKKQLERRKNMRRFNEFALRTGFEGGTRDRRAGLANALAPKHEVLIRGNLVGILSAQQYGRHLLDAPFNLNFALARLRIQDNWSEEDLNRWSARYLRWLNTLPKAAHSRTYDLAFLELVQPHALGALLNGSTNAYHVNPFNDRTLLHGSMRLRPRYRLSRKAIDTMQQNAAPELSVVPFTSDTKHVVMKALGKSPPWEDLKDLDILQQS